jgi:membrane protease YdiL (CAAX protease family)
VSAAFTVAGAQEVGATSAPAAAQLLLGLVLMCASASVAPLAVVLARHIFPGRNIFFARWGFSHVALVVLAFIVLASASALIVDATDTHERFEGLAGLVASAGLFACVVALVFRFAHKLDPDGWRSLGLRAGGNLRAVAVGVLGLTVALPGMFGAMLAWPWVLDQLGIEAVPQEVAQLAVQLHGVELAIFVVLAVLVIPLFEELLFRAFLQPLLVQNLGDRGGVAVTAVVFAGLHGATAFLPVFVLALVLGSVMLRTQRLSASWLVHALHNGLVLVLLLCVPGARDVLGQ